MAAFDCWQVVAVVLAHAKRILLWGLPGTGKTFTPTTQHVRDGRTVYSVTLTEDTPAAELRGHYIPRGGNFEWQDGSGVRAWREGAVLILNELHRAGGDMTGFLLALLDSPATARLTLPTGETITPHPDFTVVATSNGDPETLLDALRDRFPVTVCIDKVHPDALAALPVDIRVAAENTALIPDEIRRLSIRAWEAFGTLRDAVGPEYAAAAVFGESAEDALNTLALAGQTAPDKDAT